MLKSIFAIVALSINLFAINQNSCLPKTPMGYSQDSCERCHCLGPENIIANAPLKPITRDGDWSILLDALVWKIDQDGMEYAIDNAVFVPVVNPSLAALGEMNNLIDSRYETTKPKWDVGFKVGLSYAGFCDGWDIGLIWTHFQTRSRTHIEQEPGDNHSLIPLWSAFQSQHGNPLFARDIETSWNVQLDLIDLELGKEFWVSKFLSFRPLVSLRYGCIEQRFQIDHKGGSWSPRSNGSSQDPLTNEVVIQNNFHGIGVKGGFDTAWHLGCGWALFGEFGASVLHGRFEVDEKEQNRLAINPYTKTRIMDIEDRFRASRATLDLILGIKWSALVCDCKYGIDLKLGLEQHLFFHQNQMWRIQRKSVFFFNGISLPNNLGENIHEQRRGTLSTQGLIFTLEIHL